MYNKVYKNNIDGLYYDENGKVIPNFLLNTNLENTQIFETSFVANPASEKGFLAFSNASESKLMELEFQNKELKKSLNSKIEKRYEDLPKIYKDMFLNFNTYSKKQIYDVYSEIAKHYTAIALGKMPMQSFNTKQKLSDITAHRNSLIDFYIQTNYGFDYMELYSKR